MTTVQDAVAPMHGSPAYLLRDEVKKIIVSMARLSLLFNYKMELEVGNTILCRLRRHNFYAICGVLLMLSAFGGLWQRQKAGAGTQIVLVIVEHYCPAAVVETHLLSVVDVRRRSIDGAGCCA
jgi:hypothetical protein